MSKPLIKTGFAEFDNEIGGLEPGQLYIIAARPAVGKTSFAAQMCRNIGSDKTLLFTDCIQSECRCEIMLTKINELADKLVAQSEKIKDCKALFIDNFDNYLYSDSVIEHKRKAECNDVYLHLQTLAKDNDMAIVVVCNLNRSADENPQNINSNHIIRADWHLPFAKGVFLLSGNFADALNVAYTEPNSAEPVNFNFQLRFHLYSS